MSPFLLEEEILRERIAHLHRDAAAASRGCGGRRARGGRSVRRAVGMRLVKAGLLLRRTRRPSAQASPIRVPSASGRAGPAP